MANKCSQCEIYLTDIGMAREQYRTAEDEQLCQACHEAQEE